MNFDKVCRACLSDRKNLQYIFATRIPRMMETCADIQVSEKDGLPPFVCASCSYFLAKFCAFKERIEHSDKFLRDHLDKHKQNHNDILDKAVCEAQMVQLNHEVMSRKSNETQLEEQENPVEQTAEVGIVEVKEEIKSEIDVEIDDEIFEHDTDSVDANSEAFVAEPPSLVPLGPTKTLDEPFRNPDDFDTSLTAHPTPLIQNRPKDTDDSIQTYLMQIPEIALTSTSSSCNERFISVPALKEHTLTICKDGFVKCTICHRKIRNQPSNLRTHMRIHTTEKPFKCKVCNMRFVRSSNFSRHMRIHQETKQIMLNSKPVKSPKQIMLNSKPVKSPPCYCICCGKEFSEADSLQQHIRNDHDNEEPSACYKCGKSFTSLRQMHGHMWIHNDQKYKCKSCTEVFLCPGDLKNHERIHQHGDEAEKIKRLNNLFVHNTYNDIIHIE